MRTILLSMLLLLGACASVPANAPAYSRAPEPAEGLSNVYIYRIGAYPTLRAPMISIDGRNVISPAERAYTVVALAPGPHEVQVNWAWDTGWPDLKFPILVEAGKPLYLKVSGSFDNIGGNTYRAGSSTQELPQVVAEPEMTACCRYVRPMRGWSP
jgi:hypothetical protein